MLTAPARDPGRDLEAGMPSKRRPVGGWRICGLVQGPAQPQGHHVRDASAAPERAGRRDLTAPGCRLKKARQQNPHHWTRSTRCGRQPKVGWTKPPN